MTADARTSSGSRAMPPSQTTTIGAIARIGTVCEATMYGRNPRRSSRECASTTPSGKPNDGAEGEADGRLLRREERGVPSRSISIGAVAPRGLEERVDDVVHVRHRQVVDDERPSVQPVLIQIQR